MQLQKAFHIPKHQTDVRHK